MSTQFNDREIARLQQVFGKMPFLPTATGYGTSTSRKVTTFDELIDVLDRFAHYLHGHAEDDHDRDTSLQRFNDMARTFGEFVTLAMSKATYRPE